MPTVDQTILSDAFVGLETTQTILSDATILISSEQTINSDGHILVTTEQTIGSSAVILITQEQLILSDAQVQRKNPQLKLFSAAAPNTEIGTISNPIVFDGILAGEFQFHPDNPFSLFNDRGGSFESVDARDVTIQVLAIEFVDELLANSDGTASQTYTVAFPPVFEDAVTYPLLAQVGGVIYNLLDTLAGALSTDEVFLFNFSTGQITFGDGITGKIPPIGENITLTYASNTVDFGSEIIDQEWFGVQSSGIITNPVTVELERQTSDDEDAVTVAHTPIIEVTGVFLNSDPNRLGTNFFFPGGSVNGLSGIIALGTSLPAEETSVLVDYSYEIEDDAETETTPIGQDSPHTFDNPIPSNNAKQLILSITPPLTASPSGIINLRFRIRITFKG